MYLFIRYETKKKRKTITEETNENEYRARTLNEKPLLKIFNKPILWCTRDEIASPEGLNAQRLCARCTHNTIVVLLRAYVHKQEGWGRRRQFVYIFNTLLLSLSRVYIGDLMMLNVRFVYFTNHTPMCSYTTVIYALSPLSKAVQIRKIKKSHALSTQFVFFFILSFTNKWVTCR